MLGNYQQLNNLCMPTLSRNLAYKKVLINIYILIMHTSTTEYLKNSLAEHLELKSKRHSMALLTQRPTIFLEISLQRND